MRINTENNQSVLSDGSIDKNSFNRVRRSPKIGPSADLSTDPFMRFYLLLTNPDSYRLFDDIRIGTGPEGGSPGIYPRQLFSLIYVLQNATSSLTAISQTLSLPHHRKILKEMLMDASPTVPLDDRERIRKWSINPRIPCPSRIGRLLKTLGVRGAVRSEILLTLGIQLVLEDNRFNAKSGIYSEGNRIVGDGSVFTAASSQTTNEFVNQATGEIRKRRMDLVAQQYTEGGGTCVYGIKYAAIWSTGANRHDTIALGASYVSSSSPQAEARMAIELVHQAQAHLKRADASVSLVTYDRAAGRKEQESLNEDGMVLATRAYMDHAPDDKSHYRKPKPIGHTQATCGHHHYFVAIQKRLHLVVTDVSGGVSHVALQHQQRPKRRGNRIFHYSEHPYTCWCSPETDQILRISWNGRKAALSSSKNGIVLAGDKGYENMMRYLQPHAPDSDEFKVLNGKRQTAESMHSIMDQMLPFKRLQRWSLESKDSWVFGYLTGHNLVYQQLRRQEVLNQLAG